MIYLDNASTTKISEEVIADIVDSLRNDWVNPSSTYEEGLAVKRKIERARKQIADYINADPEEIIFTSSGSEANNLAIKGFMEHDKNYRFDCIISSKIEHPSVYNACEYCKHIKYDYVEYMLPSKRGRIKTYIFSPLISLLSIKHYCFVSIMMANNETGTIQPIKDLAFSTHEHQGVFHTDATQAFGKIPINVKDLDVDLMSVSLHKVGLPKGIGFLYKKKGIDISPIIHGGHQENDLRAGTENIAYIVAAGNQVERLSKKEFMNYDMFYYLWRSIVDKCPDFLITCNTDSVYSLTNILSLTFNGVNAEALITLLDMNGVCVSAGSACCSGEKTPSRVLKSMELTDEQAFSTVRISISEDTTKDEIDEFVKILGECLISLKMMDGE